MVELHFPLHIGVKMRNKKKNTLEGIDPLERLRILIDGDESLGYIGIRSRVKRIEKGLILMFIIQGLILLEIDKVVDVSEAVSTVFKGIVGILIGG